MMLASEQGDRKLKGDTGHVHKCAVLLEDSSISDRIRQASGDRRYNQPICYTNEEWTEQLVDAQEAIVDLHNGLTSPFSFSRAALGIAPALNIFLKGVLHLTEGKARVRLLLYWRGYSNHKQLVVQSLFPLGDSKQVFSLLTSGSGSSYRLLGTALGDSML